jgi:hypothetical protein
MINAAAGKDDPCVQAALARVKSKARPDHTAMEEVGDIIVSARIYHCGRLRWFVTRYPEGWPMTASSVILADGYEIWA